MLTIEDSTIYLTRGDTAYITVNLEYNDGSYEMQTGDTLTLSVKKAVEDTDYALQIITDTNTINILPADTKELEYGKYVYDIQLQTAAGEIFTVIEKSPFKLQEEVTL